MAKVGFLGTGAIAAAMVKGLSGQGHQILVSERSHNTATELSDAFEEVSVAPNDAVVANSDILILCLMADTARAVLPNLPFRADQSVLSVMADVPLADLADLCAPATNFAIFIPLPFIATGSCPLPVTPESLVLEELFGSKNIIIPCRDEKALNAHFAACSLASVTFAQMQETASWLAQHTGDANGAEAYIKALLGGYIPQIETLASAIADLNTEGGFNQTLRLHMDPARGQLKDGLDQFAPRLGL
ncbi:MAG: NAD(P)-binding domain-containing protein [Pseudomonadota bacterium]